MSRTSVLGGESGRRSWLGGSVPTWRLVSAGAAVLVAMVLTMTMAEAGFVTGVVVVAATWAATAATARGSVVSRYVTRRRWLERNRTGTVAFRPFDQGEWDALAAQARARDGKVRADAARQAAAYREVPDGAEGMGWLERRPRRPGIAWHAPTGENAYLSVVFEVSGQIRGLESDRATGEAAARWGRFLATLGSEESVARVVQSLTRVLPPDSARHEAWLLENLDPAAPRELAQSYDDLIRRSDASSMVQRHYIAVRWPLSAAFHAAAARFGEGRDGWRAFMTTEIASIARGLRQARHVQVRALSAAQVAAVMLHMQDPSRPIDQVADVDPDRFGLPSRDEYSAHVVTATDSATGEEAQWWHRTARISADALATVPRTSMWLTPMLSGGPDGTLLTLSFQTWIIPARQARGAARSDLTRDAADRVARNQDGRLLDEENELRLSAAQRRAADLRPGQHNAGVEWAGYLTISARTREELGRAARHAAAIAERDLGIERLEWLDTYQAAASGCTWPIVRGIRTPLFSAGDRVMSALSGHGAKEAL
ncbi:hypothetical protein KZX45_08405 [Georgenia sp. EYE_87]|uniref:SCO6880 family protein n=1 Tax=Georgenia sp. EYE_87 TaxID=2853448 RepID=UPI0020068707|nr:SCO6880 family protein [Georgenia sp. EYE_87]MCK6210563.1 hypothetical protein [Georgenia sp. EYE_87]